MKDSRWWLWLLGGLAIVPMLIPAWRRLTPRVQPESRRISRIWFVVAISCLIAIPVLIFLAGLVYNRIVIDPLRPPVYSVRVRPAAIWHHAEFVVSPAYGFQLAIDATIIFSYNFRDAGSYYQWNSEDRPRLVASFIEMPQGLDQYYWMFKNTGKEDATNINIKIATVDLNHTQHTLVTTPLNVRLKPGMVYPVTTAPEKDLQFLLICVAYSNDRGTDFVDRPQFYFTLWYMKRTETRSELALVTPLLYEELSAGFSCGNF